MSNKKILVGMRLASYTIDRIQVASEKSGLNKSEVVRLVFKMIEDDKIQAQEYKLNEGERIVWEAL